MKAPLDMKEIDQRFVSKVLWSFSGYNNNEDAYLWPAFAANLVMNDIDLVAVKEILGYNGTSMTVRYSHPSDKRKMEAVEKLVPGKDMEVGERSYRVDGHNLVTIGPSLGKNPETSIH